MPKSPSIRKRSESAFVGDRRRKHHHWKVTVYYKDGERFARDSPGARGLKDSQIPATTFGSLKSKQNRP
jgi:hypothetical protein